jgi:hypothetical protein
MAAHDGVTPPTALYETREASSQVLRACGNNPSPAVRPAPTRGHRETPMRGAAGWHRLRARGSTFAWPPETPSPPLT